MELTHDILDRLDQLEDKYGQMGQDMLSYLDGLLYADYLTYWDYIHLDTLLSLQTPRTPFPDESIFIIYHQITELYFKLVLQAMDQIQHAENVDATLFKRQLGRINRYFDALVHSFEIMSEGMDKEEFLKFRMSLLPASGFQSAQYRLIELRSAPMYQLVHPDKRAQASPDDKEADLYPLLYWKSGATELATGKKTLTLRQFELKYSDEFLRLARQMRTRNLWQCYRHLPEAEQQDAELIELLRTHDYNTNVRWPLAHLKSAVRYLDRKPAAIEATGGTNWQKYLPPRFQRIMFYPELWSEEERSDWGRPRR